MISAEHFTPAFPSNKPMVPGMYICLLDKNGKRFLVFGEFAPKTNANHFISDNSEYNGAMVIAWVQVEDAEIIARELINKHHA